jgi:4-amino-4-deoxy-L-arabinose transferase-like glycosyltransferase
MSPALQASSPRRPALTSAASGDSGFLTPDLWVLLAATAIGALLRFATLGHQSLWVDEATTVHEVGLSFGGMLHAVAHNEATPPLYFACAWVWTRIFSSDAVGIRSLSAVFGTAAIPVVYLCGRELISRWAGVVAACLTAASPYMIWYSQEARAYMLLALLSGLSLLFTARSLRTGRGSDLAFWALVSAAALATHFFAALLVFPEGLWLLWRLRRPAAGAAGLAVLAAAGALAPLAIHDASGPLDLWINGLALHERIQMIPVDFGASQVYRDGALRWGLWGAGVLVVLILVLAGLSGPERRRGLVLPGALAAIIVLLPIVGAALGHDYVFSRNLTPAWIPLVVLVAGVIGAERARPLGLALLAAVALLFVWADVRISADASLQKPDWRAAAAALGPARVPRAILIFDGNLGEEPLSLYLPGTTFSFSGAPAPGPRLALGEIDVVADLAATGPASTLPAGVRLASVRDVGESQVVRFALTPPRELTPQGAAGLADALMTPGSSTVSVLVQK